MKQIQRNFGGRLRPKQEEPKEWVDLVDFANEKLAFIYQRLSTHEQVKAHIWSQEAQDTLAELARKDGYPDELIYVEKRDLGISGTKGREEREGLAYLIQQVEAGLVEAVYVVHISRLYRDQTLINALALGELLKEHDVIIVTPQMRLNLKDKMHMRLYRMEIERAADEIELMSNRLLSARDLKARSGLYAGESLPPGYIVDERETLENGESNPDYHRYQIYEPHARIVRTIFERLLMPGTTPTRVARYCRQNNISFLPLPPELDTKANRKTFNTSKRNPDGSWPVTTARVRNVATNPAYIGWKVWSGEIVSKEVYEPIVDTHTFWKVQDVFKHRQSPKKGYDPPPLAGVIYCGEHDEPRRMTYANRGSGDRSVYRCRDHDIEIHCVTITAHILDDPIGEAIISQFAVPDIADRVLQKLTDEYNQVKDQAASYRRETKRLNAEVDNLLGNLATGILGSEQVTRINEQVQQRLDRIQELADLESQPIGAALGRPAPGQADIDLVKSFIANLDREWQTQPNGFKNAFLRLILDRVTIWFKENAKRIRVRLIWRGGLEQELLIRRPQQRKRLPWTQAELRVMEKHYRTGTHSELLTLLPNRTWKAIAHKGAQMGMARETDRKKPGGGVLYTEEEDELVRRYYAGEIGPEVATSTGRTLDGIRGRARALGLLYQPRKVRWEWLDKGEGITPIAEEESPSASVRSEWG